MLLRKIYILPLASLMTTIGCFTSYRVIGSHISANGTLVEPFFLIPIGFLFLVITLFSALLISGDALRKVPTKADRLVFFTTLACATFFTLYLIASFAYQARRT